MWYISATLLLYVFPFEVLERKSKVAPDDVFRENELKSKVLLIAVFIFVSISAKSQVAISDYVPLQTGMFSWLWYPHVAISTTDNESFQLNLRILDQYDYTKIPQDGKMLVKFVNDSIVTIYHTDVPQYQEFQVGKYGKTGKYYITVDNYEIEDVDYFLNNEIAKIRVELRNYDYFDFEINRSYQHKFNEELNNAYLECTTLYQEKSNKRDNFGEGF